MVTDDAGVSWRDATPPGLTAAWPSIEFVDPEHAWLLQALSVDANAPNAPIPSALWRTSDGGRHWQREALPTQAIFEAAISFVGPDKGYLVLVPDAGADYRRTLVYSTTDGAGTWAEVGRISGDLQFDTPPDHPLAAVIGDDALLVSGRALQTHDGGRTWSPIDLPRPAEIPASSEVDVRQLVVAGGDLLVSAQYIWKTGASYTYAPGYEFVSHDRGRTWTLAWTGNHGLSDRTKIVAIDEATMYQFSDYAATIPDSYDKKFSVTQDAGRTWTSVSASLPTDTHFDIESFGDALNGWAVVSPDAHCPAGMGCPYAGGLPGQLVATRDGGSTWTTGASR
jgi:photosystem II stability/assembly factor-like uncharacterized protein